MDFNLVICLHFPLATEKALAHSFANTQIFQGTQMHHTAQKYKNSAPCIPPFPIYAYTFTYYKATPLTPNTGQRQPYMYIFIRGSTVHNPTRSSSWTPPN